MITLNPVQRFTQQALGFSEQPGNRRADRSIWRSMDTAITVALIGAGPLSAVIAEAFG